MWRKDKGERGYCKSGIGKFDTRP